MSGTALVTGAARRIGRALAQQAAKAGYAVAIHHRDSAADAASLKAEIDAMGGRAAVFAADLQDRSAPERLIGDAAAALGPVTLLINSASLLHDDRIGGLREHWDAQFETNLRAPVFLAQAFANALPAAAEGLIVNLLDQRVTHPNPQYFSYTLTKAALHTATVTMAQALAPRIRVNAIAPGPSLQSIHQTPEEFAAEAAAVPLGRPSSPEDLAAALSYLISARSVTGHTLFVDGGQHLAWKTPDILGD